jgi:DNA-binding GntR family transcriptional regulator
MSQAPEPRFETKSQWVYARLREMITTGELPSGERLRLTQLADRFRTSEMPVREALRMLQQDGLIVMESHRGAAVATVTWERVYEAVLVRMHLEVLASSEATPHHDAGSAGELRALLRRMDRMAERNRGIDFSEANRRFHTLAYEPCPHPMLKAEIQQLWDTVWQTRSRSLFRMKPGRMRPAQREHRALVDAFANHDAPAAAAAARTHMDRTLAAWRSLRDRAGSPPPDPPGARAP